MSEVFGIAPNMLQPWLVATLIMDEVTHLIMQRMLQEWYDCEHVTISVERASWEFRRDLMSEESYTEGGDLRLAAWELLFHHIRERSIPSNYVWKMTWYRLFGPEGKPATTRKVVNGKMIEIKAEPVEVVAEPEPAPPLATAEQIAAICGKFGGAIAEPRVVEGRRPHKPRTRANLVPKDLKRADVNYGACQQVKPKANPATKNDGQKPQKKSARLR